MFYPCRRHRAFTRYKPAETLLPSKLGGSLHPFPRGKESLFPTGKKTEKLFRWKKLDGYRRKKRVEKVKLLFAK